eukprot:786000-Rhodomonas_salina.1
MLLQRASLRHLVFLEATWSVSAIRLRAPYAMPGTDVAYAAVRGTDVAYAATRRRPRPAMSGPEIAYQPTRPLRDA